MLIALVSSLKHFQLDAQQKLIRAHCNMNADKTAEDEPAMEEQPSAKPSTAFWEDLLKDGYTDLHVIQQAALGKGKRERRQVRLTSYTPAAYR